MIKVKICGITNLEDALNAQSLGADALGFVFCEDSPRYISPKEAGDIIKKLPPFVKSVGLFVNEKREMIDDALKSSGIDLIQFHGDEDESFCKQFNLPFIKAIRVTEDINLLEYMSYFESASAFLLDSYSGNARGGTGHQFNWELIPADTNVPLVIAGGLNPDNIKSLLEKRQPYAVDVSSGVESAKGKKDLHKMKQFMDGVKNATL